MLQGKAVALLQRVRRIKSVRSPACETHGKYRKLKKLKPLNCLCSHFVTELLSFVLTVMQFEWNVSVQRGRRHCRSDTECRVHVSTKPLEWSVGRRSVCCYVTCTTQISVQNIILHEISLRCLGYKLWNVIHLVESSSSSCLFHTTKVHNDRNTKGTKQKKKVLIGKKHRTKIQNYSMCNWDTIIGSLL